MFLVAFIFPFSCSLLFQVLFSCSSSPLSFVGLNEVPLLFLVWPLLEVLWLSLVLVFFCLCRRASVACSSLILFLPLLDPIQISIILKCLCILLGT